MFPESRGRSSVIGGNGNSRSEARIGVRLAALLAIRWGIAVAVAAPDVKRSAVLILSEDPLTAALIGGAVELVGFEPAFPTDGEPPRHALRRTRPRLVVVDCDHHAACAPSFFGPVLMTGARVVVLASRHSRPDAVPLAEGFGLRPLMLPADVDSIAERLRGELEAAAR
jgi:hypothetical protein